MSDKPPAPIVATLENRLSAYLDDELAGLEHLQVCDLLNSDPSAQSMLDRLQLGSELGNAAFAAVLDKLKPALRLRRSRFPIKGSGGEP